MVSFNHLFIDKLDRLQTCLVDLVHLLCGKTDPLCYDEVYLESLSQGLYHLLLGNVFEIRRADQYTDYLKTGSFNSVLTVLESSHCKLL